MEEKTDEKILKTALRLFAKYGYHGTSMRDIAGELGLTKATLYRHFSGKEEILDVIIRTGEEYYESKFGSFANPPQVPETVTELKQLSMNQIAFTMHDPAIVEYRRMFTIEQFLSDKMAKLATKHFVTGIENMYCGIFSGMMENGILKKNDPGFLAYEYVSPITLMIHLCDRQPEKEEEALKRMERHIDYFIEINAV